MDIIVSKSGGEIHEVMHLEIDEFIGIMLRIHQANLSRKWCLMVKMRKWKNLTSLYQRLFKMMKISDFG